MQNSHTQWQQGHFPSSEEVCSKICFSFGSSFSLPRLRFESWEYVLMIGFSCFHLITFWAGSLFSMFCFAFKELKGYTRKKSAGSAAFLDDTSFPNLSISHLICCTDKHLRFVCIVSAVTICCIITSFSCLFLLKHRIIAHYLSSA
jgi:hypothetical protein